MPPLPLVGGGGGLNICEIKYGYHDNKRDRIKIDLAFISGDKKKNLFWKLEKKLPKKCGH